ncbi:phage portal protein [Ignavigranum ruoffiae]|uniref:phage portal protein n=1 Tax=Ignavigranum ruoffiae TaxID=89093 RepID=UPI002357454C|nr:phage portal protein [Ignavigranum ruoffiae]
MDINNTGRLLNEAPVFFVDKNKEITDELISELIQKHQNAVGRYDYLLRLYKNHAPIFFADSKERFKPDNRVGVPFGKYIIDTFCGYFNGIPIRKKHKSEPYLQKIKDFDAANNVEKLEATLLKEACIYGHAFEYMYQTETAETKSINISPKEIFIVYTKEIIPQPYMAIYYGVDKQKKTGYIITLDEIKAFEETHGEIKIVDQKINPYNHLPVTEWVLNDERIGLIEPITSLINSYNKVLSEKANDVEYFSDAYLSILGAELDEKTIEKIGDNRIINLFGGDTSKTVVEFLDKPDSDSQTENQLDRLERLIYHTAMVANISDENFGNASGVSLAYKMQAMSNLALSVQRNFQSSLDKRYELFSSLRTNVSDVESGEWKNLEYVFTRNEPKNLLEESQVAAQLIGITSNETALSVLSMVSDVGVEMEKIKKEKPNTMDYELGGQNEQQDLLA